MIEQGGSTRTGTRTQDQLIKSQLLYQLSYPRLHFPRAGAGQLGVDPRLGKLIFGTKLSFSDDVPLTSTTGCSRPPVYRSLPSTADRVERPWQSEAPVFPDDGAELIDAPIEAEDFGDHQLCDDNSSKDSQGVEGTGSLPTFQPLRSIGLSSTGPN